MRNIIIKQGIRGGIQITKKGNTRPRLRGSQPRDFGISVRLTFRATLESANGNMPHSLGPLQDVRATSTSSISLTVQLYSNQHVASRFATQIPSAYHEYTSLQTV